MKRSARMAAFLLAAALSAAPCLAEFTPVEVPQATNTSAAPEAMENVPQITEKGLTLGNNSVKYPEITGMADESIQQQVNDAILQAGKIENRLSRMAVLMSSPVPLTVTYSAALADDVLSVAILSSGALETERATQEWAAVNIDLRTGQEITFDDLFTDADEARAKMEETIADEILPDMSAHLGGGGAAALAGCVFADGIRLDASLLDSAVRDAFGTRGDDYVPVERTGGRAGLIRGQRADASWRGQAPEAGGGCEGNVDGCAVWRCVSEHSGSAGRQCAGG